MSKDSISIAQSPGLTLDDFLCFAVYSASHAFNRLYKPMLDRLGLTYPQYLAMVALWEGGEPTVGELGERLHLESNTLTPLLKRLEGMGLVTRARDPRDERQVRIGLTDKGRELRGPACAVPGEMLATTGLTVGDLARLRGEVAALRDLLERAEAA